jgi:hypothetical protein
MSETIQGVVEVCLNPNQWGKLAVLVDGNWYGTGLDQVNFTIPAKGDMITFNGGKTGKYLNAVKIVSSGHEVAEYEHGAGGSPKTAGSAPRAAPAKATGGGYSTLGVEIGHASNIASAMAMAKFKPDEVGSASYYHFFLEHTQQVYRMVKGLKEKIVDGSSPVPPEVTEVADSDDLSDIFK